MRPVLRVLGLLAFGAAAFGAGAWFVGHSAGGPTGTGDREILYYVDPMNPALTSDKPGIAPCGMPLEPVYADDDRKTLPPGSVRVGAEKQQILGVRTGRVERKPLSRTLRLTGRVAADETRVYRITSVTEGWVREVTGVTTGSFVRKGDILAAYYAQEVQGPQQAYLYALEALDRFRSSGSATPDQIALNENNVRNAKQALRNLGMGETQIEEIARSRKASPNVEIRSPVGGIVLQRNVTMGQQFDRTLDLFVIADLSRVWILADAFEEDGHQLAPGTEAVVIHRGFEERYPARVGSVPPVFDAASRTLKVRLTADNPENVLRPDMFVDVEADIRASDRLVVPVDAVLDSGERKTVFVDRGEGVFEPRSVETGRRFDGEVEILGGLMPGEAIVVSGNFLIDSESRMKAALATMKRPTSKDPICGMDVDEVSARSQGLSTDSGGKTWFFCAPGCKEEFERRPRP
jgi:RND family efflux transporter MFP subunit